MELILYSTIIINNMFDIVLNSSYLGIWF